LSHSLGGILDWQPKRGLYDIMNIQLLDDTDDHRDMEGLEIRRRKMAQEALLMKRVKQVSTEALVKLLGKFEKLSTRLR
jgi:hypothetical protein